MSTPKPKRSYELLTEYKKSRICRLAGEGKTQAKIAEEVGVARTTITNYLKRTQNPETCDRKRGRPKKVTDGVRRAVIQKTLEDRNLALNATTANNNINNNNNNINNINNNINNSIIINTNNNQQEFDLQKTMNPTIQLGSPGEQMPVNNPQPLFPPIYFDPKEKCVYTEKIDLSRENIRKIRLDTGMKCSNQMKMPH